MTTLHTLLTHSLDLLSLTLTYCYNHPPPSSPTTTSHPPLPSLPSLPSPDSPPLFSPTFLSAQLRLLSQSLSESVSLLKGPPLTTSDPAWTTRSVSPSHFFPPGPLPKPSNPATQPPPLSFHLGIQEGSIVLWLRSLEAADAPVGFGSKLAFAIGTSRRLEHDEAERVFGFCCSDSTDDAGHGGGHRHSLGRAASNGSAPVTSGRKEIDVFVREKVRVESADPSLLSLAAKLAALGHVLDVARQNLAAVMGEEVED